MNVHRTLHVQRAATELGSRLLEIERQFELTEHELLWLLTQQLSSLSGWLVRTDRAREEQENG